MGERKTTDQKFLHIESRIAIFIFVAVAGMIAVWFFIGKQQHLFSPKKNVFFVTENGKNMQQGVSVTFSGFKIGKVSSVTLTDDNKVLVKMSIISDYIKRIKKDSEAMLTKELPMGESFIEIKPGSKDSAAIKDNEYITFVKARWFPAREDEISTIPISLANSPQVLDLIAEVKRSFNNDLGPIINDLKFTLKNFRSVSEDALVTRQYLDTMYLNANNNLNALDTLMTRLNKDIPEIVDKAHESFDSIKIMAEDIREVTINAFAELTHVIGKGSELAGDVKEITSAVKMVWPISSKIKKNAKRIAKEGVKEEKAEKEETVQDVAKDKE